MDDLISRADVEALFRDARKRLKASDYKTFDEFNTRDLMLLNAEQLIHILPSVSVAEKTGRWIPVSERLPEESLNSVIGWDAYRERCVFVQYIQGRFQIMGRNESFDVKAWMPLPTPFEPQESEERDEKNGF